MRGSKPFDHKGRKEGWRGKDHELRLVLRLTTKNTECLAGAPYSVYQLPVPYERAYPLQQTFHDPAVPFRPGQRTFLLWLARGEVMNSRPCRSLRCHGSIVVATAVIHVPV